ncbi:zinc finger MYM-type protein 1-like [Aphis craccivora]|uniref:Zinc finger MYM-type protein 1-like n=1 Tax=Aphis craccivora TaxID=307492 RepID=A0A6G0XRH6_APHCR|nr:zinc finger MYM-type protein 1-like [Aphis craccivora]
MEISGNRIMLITNGWLQTDGVFGTFNSCMTRKNIYVVRRKEKKEQEKQFTSKLTKITGFFTALNPVIGKPVKVKWGNCDAILNILKTNDQTLVLPHLAPSSSSCTEIEESNLISDTILDHDE